MGKIPAGASAGAAVSRGLETPERAMGNVSRLIKGAWARNSKLEDSVPATDVEVARPLAEIGRAHV